MRWASRRRRSRPAFLAWSLETHPRIHGTESARRAGARAGTEGSGDRAGAGRLLIPAARRVFPEGEAVGIDIQSAMITRLERADEAGVTNLRAILGDAAQPHVPEASFDIVFLCAALGEIRIVLRHWAVFSRPQTGRRSLRHRDVWRSALPDRSVVERLAEGVGFRLRSVRGGWWLYTADFIK